MMGCRRFPACGWLALGIGCQSVGDGDMGYQVASTEHTCHLSFEVCCNARLE